MQKYYAIVPAAGTGARFGATLPKQYLPILGRPVLWHTLSILCAHPRIERVWVILAPGDPFWGDYDWVDLGPKLEVLFCGGGSRATSVISGLKAAVTAIKQEDWVLVHDAARPCLTAELLDRLFNTLSYHPVGGLLATPVADTLKRATPDAEVIETIPREDLWQAQTPQMFRYGLLCQALTDFPNVTDEASAIEAAGYPPCLVTGSAYNLKVTYPVDLELASLILQTRRLHA